MNRILLVSAAVALGGFISTQASAHAFLTTASPKVGSTVSASPREIVLNFTEGLEPAFSSVEVDGPSGAKIAAGKPMISGARMVVTVTRPLASGVYKVVWHATAVDTHKTQGSFNFTIKP
jgi:copper resistance protein C